MRSIITYYDNGDKIATKINANIDQIVNYYLGKQFTFADSAGKEKAVTCRAIKFLDPIQIPTKKNASVVVRHICTLSDEYMRRYRLTNRIRVEYMVHYHGTGKKAKSNCAYKPGMFGEY